MAGRRGAVLIVVLAVLLILALLATVFVTLSSLERSVSHNYLDDVRARQLAQSGVDHGITRLREILPRGFLDGAYSDSSWLYYGDVVNEANPPNPGVPIEKAANPSFAVETTAGPKTFVVGGSTVGYSGAAENGRYGKAGDQYALRVTDCSGQINVNDGAPWGPSHSVSRNLERVLNVLGMQPSVNVPNLGTMLLAKRPVRGYQSKYEILGALNFDSNAFDRAAPFLTTSSWTDTTVVNPVPFSSTAASSYPVTYDRPNGVYRFGHNRNYVGTTVTAPLQFYTPGNPNPFHHAIWGVDSLNPQWIETVARSPVNVNTARREVLMALLVDLEGVFVVERRRDNPYSPPSSSFGWSGQTGGYGWLGQILTYDPNGNEGDECGFLYRTLPLIGPGGTGTSGISAAFVVDEIIACREKKTSPHCPGTDYSAYAFGGPFRSWAQFNLFVDHLVRAGLLADNRPIFTDYDSNGNAIPGSAAQKRIASQAIADVLKANFNPNLHLNELNPDRILFTHVDKTDLVVNSTEFCFTPMGTFEIESLGRVLLPKEGDDCLTASDNQVVAEKKISAVVRLFDAVRQTTQSQFYESFPFSNRTTWPETNNNRGIETGPEVDNGPQPMENRWSGYVALPTLGGNRGNSFEWGSYKPKGALWTTYPIAGFFPGCAQSINGGVHLGSSLHAHFQLDAVAHHHLDKTNLGGWDGFKLPLGAWWLVYGGRASIAMNWEDKGEPILSPYTPADSGYVTANGPHRYRLGRSFSMPAVGSSGSAPIGFAYPPSDLRIDGLYCERGSSIGYWITQNSSFNFNEGVAAFWLKPNFHPECTGKPRTLLSMSRFHNYSAGTVNLSPFTLFFLPAHDAPGASSYESPSIPSYYGGIGKFRPASLGFGIGFHPATGYNWELSGNQNDQASLHANVISPTLNHEMHGPDNGSRLLGDDGKPNLLRAHEWMHVAVTWKFTPGTLHDADSVQIFINGQIQPGTVGIPSFYGTGEPIASSPMWHLHSMQVNIPGYGTNWAANSVRIGGEISRLIDSVYGMPGSIWPRNYTADATFDEFYLWTNRSTGSGMGLAGAQTLWYRGRYYRPSDANAADGVFESIPLVLGGPPRQVPNTSTIPFPDGTATPTTQVVPGASKKRILGIAWTAYAENYDAAGTPGVLRPMMYDYSAWPPSEMRPASAADANGYSAETIADTWVVVDGVTYGPFRNDLFSPVVDSAGLPVEVTTSAQYRVKLKIGPKTPSTILLATPVLDDVTVFFDSGHPEIVGWLLVNVSR